MLMFCQSLRHAVAPPRPVEVSLLKQYVSMSESIRLTFSSKEAK